MAAARAAASAQHKAEQAEWHRRIELQVEIRRLALLAVKEGIKAMGDKVQLYSRAQLITMANASISGFLIEAAKAKIAQRSL
jgi:hypothetical protein